MSLTVVVQETALRALARIRTEDKEAFASIRRALAALAEQPRPDEAVAWGGSGIYRLRLPGIRILYEVDEDAAAVYVINVAVTVWTPVQQTAPGTPEGGTSASYAWGWLPAGASAGDGTSQRR